VIVVIFALAGIVTGESGGLSWFIIIIVARVAVVFFLRGGGLQKPSSTVLVPCGATQARQVMFLGLWVFPRA
jgi:hypothetical protein